MLDAPNMGGAANDHATTEANMATICGTWEHEIGLGKKPPACETTQAGEDEGGLAGARKRVWGEASGVVLSTIVKAHASKRRGAHLTFKDSQVHAITYG